MSFEYYKAQDSPAARERRSSRLKGKETEPAPKPTDLTQTIRKRKRKVLADNTIVNVVGTPAPAKRTRKDDEAAKEEDKAVKEKPVEEKKPEDDAMDIDEPADTPKKTPVKKTPVKAPRPPKTPAREEEVEEEDLVFAETPKRANLKRKAQEDSESGVAVKKRRKNVPLENEAILTTKRFADLFKTQVPNAVAKVNVPGIEEPVNQFVEKYISQHGSIRTFPKKGQADTSVPALPPAPRTQALSLTEQRQRRRLATLQEEKATLVALKSKSIKPEVRASSLDFPAGSQISQGLRLLSDDERTFFENVSENPSEFNSTLESIVLQSDDLLLRTKQISQFGVNIEDYFSRVARALRREEIGDGAPLAFGGLKH